jgi:phage shock protein A
VNSVNWESVVTAVTALVAVVGTLGLERLIPYLLEQRARRRQAEGEASKAVAEAGKIEAEASKIKAETEEKTLDGAFKLINVLTNQIKLLEERVDNQEREIRSLRKTVARYAQRIEYLMRGIRVLLVQLEEQQVQPCWRPDEWDPEGAE